jgi:transcriptional regulator with XRE-family HTH domain
MRPLVAGKRGIVTGEPSVRRRLVGTALRRYRENVGYALDDAAKVLECDRSKISRIETGQRGIRPKELRELLTDYGVPENEQDALVGLCRRSGQRGWWEHYAGILPDAFLDYVIMEATAAEIMIYEAQRVPDLLQIAEYARAIAAAEPGGEFNPKRTEAMVAASAIRQELVLGGGGRLGVVIGEAALRQEVGGRAVMVEQISRLAEFVSLYPNVALQVLPFSAGAHAAAASSSLSVLRFPHTPSLGVVYLGSLSGGVYLDNQAHVAQYIRAFSMLQASALTIKDSARMLAQASVR